ncbi:Uncharacterised protein [Mycobacteroides abscessus subsp. abscessus]|nr:Uncharacterised protein [Mycobacteroides abscessus subsp. abscessus]
MAGGAEHHPVAFRGPAKRMCGGIGPRPVRHSAVGFHLDDHGRHAPRFDGGTKQAPRGLHRVGVEGFGTHSPIVLDASRLASPRAARPLTSRAGQ